MSIRLGTDVVKDIAKGVNKRTVAHELGHTGGLSHVKGKENTSNLMMQAIDADYYGQNFNNATYLNRNQIKAIRDNYIYDKLNKYSPLYNSGGKKQLRKR